MSDLFDAIDSSEVDRLLSEGRCVGNDGDYRFCGQPATHRCKLEIYDDRGWAPYCERHAERGRRCGGFHVERLPDGLPDLELLRKFATGEGGRRTGDLIRRGFIRVEVTEAGRAALHDLEHGDG